MIKIEEVGDINSDYPYLEVFLKDNINPFLEVAISENKELSFKIHSSTIDIQLNIEEWQLILSKTETFMAQALKNEDDFLNFTDQ